MMHWVFKMMKFAACTAGPDAAACAQELRVHAHTGRRSGTPADDVSQEFFWSSLRPIHTCDTCDTCDTCAGSKAVVLINFSLKSAYSISLGPRFQSGGVTWQLVRFPI